MPKERLKFAFCVGTDLCSCGMNGKYDGGRRDREKRERERERE